jgi:hypothetical protein
MKNKIKGIIVLIMWYGGLLGILIGSFHFYKGTCDPSGLTMCSGAYLACGLAMLYAFMFLLILDCIWRRKK